MSKHDEISADGARTMIDLYGEPTIFRPLSGGTRAIMAIVKRPPKMPMASVAGGIDQHIKIKVLNDHTEGITSGELDQGSDHIDVAPVKGASLETRTITQILDDTGAMLVLEVQ